MLKLAFKWQLGLTKAYSEMTHPEYTLDNELECPYCGYTIRAFLPYGRFQPTTRTFIGAGYRENCICPACGIKDRGRLFLKYLKTTNLVHHHILHISPEKHTKEYILSQCSRGFYLDGDIDPKYFYNKYGVSVQLQMDVTAIPCPSECFDFVICSNVLEHVDDEESALNELYRVLKKRGQAIIQIPYDSSLDTTFEMSKALKPQERLLLYGQEDHCRLYGNDWKKRILQAGFIDASMKPVDFIVTHDIKRYAINPNEILMLFTKQ